MAESTETPEIDEDAPEVVAHLGEGAPEVTDDCNGFTIIVVGE